MASKPIKGITIELEGNTTKLSAALKKSEDDARQLTREMREINNALRINPQSLELLGEKSKIAEDKVKALSEKLRFLKDNQEAVNSGMAKNKDGTAVSAEQIKHYNREITVTSATLQAAQKELEDTNSKIENFGKTADDAGKKSKEFWGAVGATFVGNLAADAVRSLSRELVSFAKAAPAAAIEFETAFAGVLKTVDGTSAELTALKDGIRQMALEIPSTTTEISAVAEAAGQLGIETGSILGFTEVMIGLGEATNLSAETAASSLAKFANITRMSQGEFDRLGSVIVALGNTFATTEADITSMGTRLASAGTSIGLSEAQIMGLATAMSSLGIEAESGGTAMSKTMTQIHKAVQLGGDGLERYAKVAGMSAAEFKRAWERDAAGALTRFIAGISSFEDKGKDAVVVLDELGIKEARQSDTLRRLTGNYELLEQALSDAGAAWNDNSALTEETSKRYQTTESQIVLMKNALYDMGITAGEAVLPAIRELSENIRDFTKDNKEDIAGFADTFGGVLMFCAENVNMLKNALLSLGAAFAFTKAVDGVRRINDVISAISTVKLAAEASGKSVSGFSAALSLLTSPAGLAAAGIGAFLFTVNTLNDKYPPVITKTQELSREVLKSTENYKKLSEAVEEQIKAYDNSFDNIERQLEANGALTDEIFSLAEAERQAALEGEDTTAARAVMLEKIKLLNDAVPGLALAYNAEAGELTKTRAEIDEYIKAREKELMFEAAFEAQKDIQRQFLDIETQIYEVKKKRAELEQQQKSGDIEGIENPHRRAKAEAEYRRAIEETYETEKALVEQRETLTEKSDFMYAQVGEAAANSAEAVVAANEAIAESETGTSEITEEEKEKQKEIYDSYVKHTQDIFDTISENAAISVDTLISNLEKNQETIRAWSENLSALAEKGIDEGLLETLREAGPEAAKTVELLVSASDEEFKRLNEAFRNGSKEATAAALRELGLPEVINAGSDAVDEIASGIEQNKSVETEMASLVTNTKEALSKGIEEADFPSAGENISRGVARGISNGEAEVVNASIRLANSALNASKKALDERSPSKKMAEIGENAALGFAVGIEGSAEAVKDAGGKMAADFTSAAYSELVSGRERLQSELDKIGSSVPKNMKDAKKALEDELKDVEAAIKEKRDNFIKYGEAVTQAVKNQAAERYEVEKEALKEELQIYREVKYDEKSLLEDYSSDYERLSTDGLRLIEDLTGEKTRIISQSYIDELALIDENTAAALSGINSEIEAELEKLFITNRGLYEEIAGIREKREELEKAHEEELKRREKEAEAKRIAELQARISEAETIEAQIKAHEDYFAYLKQLEEKEADEKYREEIKRLTELEKEKLDSARNVAEQARRIQEDALKEADALLSGGEKEYEAINGDRIKAAYDEAVKYAASAAVDIVKAGPEAAKAILEAYNPDWAMAGKSFIEFFEAGTKEMEPGAIETFYDIGDNVISGFIEGLRAREAEVYATVQRILAEAAKVGEATLDIHSPSRVFRKIGADAGAGFEYGLLDAAPLVNRAAEMLGLASLSGVQNITKNEFNRAGDTAGVQNNITNQNGSYGDIHVHLAIENFNNAGSRDIEDLSEELAFYLKKGIKGVGA